MIGMGGQSEDGAAGKRGRRSSAAPALMVVMRSRPLIVRGRLDWLWGEGHERNELKRKKVRIFLHLPHVGESKGRGHLSDHEIRISPIPPSLNALTSRRYCHPEVLRRILLIHRNG